ncbi:MULTISPECIES: Ku protein [unclassified Herbaspirillum]|jgi:DNA end-binding protein Ku|uniref:non-homologous end joining protein Ku n=1 Tax=Herbaspirillum TaxID=963 RepID=UPI000C0BB876|nr:MULTISPECIES: Ku protein [unclassified Herbaspirillum]MAF03281.1 Ku protein [Herbaspirillum sp.]MBO16294.1 Ku protein [Herbaspirillum sp.]MCP3655280.1 Ku protein [Herbaspirillum sp.]MCP3945542.1 Ku protein [Herbaspirillum sp.]MCP4031858.1 Ku protein [Herbaspirillum sp.]
MRRALWKGAISFGLINIPVELYTAEKHDELDFTLLDKRDLSPVGYKRYNKKSGREVPWENIIKGYQYEEGKFVLMSDEDLRQANVEATQSIDIQSFVEREQVPILYYEQPYFLAPAKGGDKAYALLRETLLASDKMAIAQIVIRTRQHLAALIPQGDMLQLITLRYPSELRAPDDLPVPSRKSKKSAVTKQEVEMARALVDHMSSDWEPGQFHDTYRDDVLALIKKKIKSRQTHAVAEPDEAAAPATSGAKVVDLMALLKSSLEGRGKSKPAPKDKADESTAKVHKMADRKPAAKRSSAAKSESRTAARSKASPRSKAAASKSTARSTPARANARRAQA